jgi:hypothetical protein
VFIVAQNNSAEAFTQHARPATRAGQIVLTAGQLGELYRGARPSAAAIRAIIGAPQH